MEIFDVKSGYNYMMTYMRKNKGPLYNKRYTIANFNRNHSDFEKKILLYDINSDIKVLENMGILFTITMSILTGLITLLFSIIISGTQGIFKFGYDHSNSNNISDIYNNNMDFVKMLLCYGGSFFLILCVVFLILYYFHIKKLKNLNLFKEILNDEII